jgi:hypothetical protein
MIEALYLTRQDLELLMDPETAQYDIFALDGEDVHLR